jgi:hypothetical protein
VKRGSVYNYIDERKQRQDGTDIGKETLVTMWNKIVSDDGTEGNSCNKRSETSQSREREREITVSSKEGFKWRNSPSTSYHREIATTGRLIVAAHDTERILQHFNMTQTHVSQQATDCHVALARIALRDTNWS